MNTGISTARVTHAGDERARLRLRLDDLDSESPEHQSARDAPLRRISMQIARWRSVTAFST